MMPQYAIVGKTFCIEPGVIKLDQFRDFKPEIAGSDKSKSATILVQAQILGHFKFTQFGRRGKTLIVDPSLVTICH